MAAILIVEDNLDLLALLADFLRSMGHTVSTAVNGKEALRNYEEGHSDVVITDMVMPEMDGVQTIMELRKKHPEVKIIAMSGGGRINGEQYLKIALNLGANKTIAKPFNIPELVSLIDQQLAA